ncbi:MAG: hypothetical protein ACNS62_07345 [Candidatus Cyclobacteriaceae bacterium M3_2C_046]
MFSKIKWILGITIVFFLILATNYIDRNNFRRIQESIETIYADRLIAQDLVFEMSLISQEKVLSVATLDSGFNSDNQVDLNNEMDRLIELFRNTKLTQREARVFDDLQNDFMAIRNFENKLNNGFAREEKQQYKDLLADLNQTIYDLSKIQLDEGRRQLEIAKRAVRSTNLLTTIEVYFLIFLAILLQVIVIYKPKQG